MVARTNAQSNKVHAHVPPAVREKVEYFMLYFEVNKKHKLDWSVPPKYYVHGGKFTVVLRYFVTPYYTEDYILILSPRGDILYQ